MRLFSKIRLAYVEDLDVDPEVQKALGMGDWFIAKEADEDFWTLDFMNYREIDDPQSPVVADVCSLSWHLFCENHTRINPENLEGWIIYVNKSIHMILIIREQDLQKLKVIQDYMINNDLTLRANSLVEIKRLDIPGLHT